MLLVHPNGERHGRAHGVACGIRRLDAHWGSFGAPVEPMARRRLVGRAWVTVSWRMPAHSPIPSETSPGRCNRCGRPLEGHPQ